VEPLIRSLGPRIYLDANVVVYVVEGFAAYETLIRAILRALDDQEIIAVTSELTVAEVLVKPKQDKNAPLQEAYLRFLEPSGVLELVPVSQAVLVASAEIRATSPLKLPDAIHVATAQQAGCDTFLTNDRSLQSWTAPPAKLVSSLVIS